MGRSLKTFSADSRFVTGGRREFFFEAALAYAGDSMARMARFTIAMSARRTESHRMLDPYP